MSRKTINPRLPLRLGVRKEFSEGVFNGKLDGFDATTGWYHVKYEDNDSEELSENEVFSVARAFRDYRRHRGTNNSGAMNQVGVPRRTAVRRAVKSTKPVVHTIPAYACTSAVVPDPVLASSQSRTKRLIALWKDVVFLWGLGHLVYSFVTICIGKY